MLLSCNSNKNKLPSLKETYSSKDKIPFGAFVAYTYLEQMFANNTIYTRKKDFNNTWQSISDTGSLYFCISKNLYLTYEDRVAMLQYVNAGNDLFIASDNIDTSFLDTLHCAVNKYEYDFYGVESMKNSSLSLNPDVYADTGSYNYFYYPFVNKFSKIDTGYAKVLGYNSDRNPNFIVVFYGKGRIYLHCDPRAFSNYFLLKKNNYNYVKQAVSIMPGSPQYIYWDDYYCKLNYPPNSKGARTGLSYLLQFPALKNAILLSLLAALLYILFGGKRRQRIIKEIAPVTNTTVAFTETIGRLYLQKKDNKNIAEKIITYFYEQLRNTYFLNTNQLNEEFLQTLSRKSGVSKEQTDSLFKTIEDVQSRANISDELLLSLNTKIENFNKNKK